MYRFRPLRQALLGLLVLGAGNSVMPAAAQNLVVSASDSSFLNGYVDEYTPSGAFVRHLVTPGSGGLEQAYNLRFGPDGNLYVASSNPSGIPGSIGNNIKEYDGTTGAYIRDVIQMGPSGVGDFLFDSSGHVYAGFNNAVGQVDLATGAILRTYSVPNGPAGLAFRANGDLLVTDALDSTVIDLNPVTGATSTFATGIGTARGITQGPDGNYYINKINNGGIGVVGPNGGAIQTWSTDPGNHYFSVFENGSMFVTTPSGSTVDVLDGSSGALQARYSIFATGIAVRPQSAVPEPGMSAFFVGSVVCGGLWLRGRRRALQKKPQVPPSLS